MRMNHRRQSGVAEYSVWCKHCWFHDEPDGYIGIRYTGEDEIPTQEVLDLRNEGFKCPKHGNLKPAFVYLVKEELNQKRIV